MLNARTPSGVIGNFRDYIGMPADHFARFAQHAVVRSVETTSALMAPFFTMSQISRMSSRKGFFSLAARVGLVVTPSRMPKDCALADFVEICGVEEEFHVFHLCD